MAGAAFYDLEGTLVSTNLVHTLSFYARRQQGLIDSFKKSATTFLSLPLFAVTDSYSRKVFNDLISSVTKANPRTGSGILPTTCLKRLSSRPFFLGVTN